ncbi:MAG: hypothetical protein AABY07_01265 [Nanoarchaeota archaeon]
MEYICDRCKEKIEGGWETYNFTAGFYRIGANQWEEFGNPGEEIICDNCMHKDHRYIEKNGLLSYGNTPLNEKDLIIIVRKECDFCREEKEVEETYGNRKICKDCKKRLK